MTKRNLTLGTASGKLGSTVYYRRRGQQITRVLVSSINDKRTLNQCYVRGRFANYVALWRMLRPYVELSWRGVSRYGSRENAFYKHNRGFMPLSSLAMSRAGYAFPNLGLVTYGSLPIALRLAVGNYYVSDLGQNKYALWLDNVVSSNISLDVSSLSNLLIRGGIGVEEGDVMHVLWYVFSYYPNTFNPEGAMQRAPQVIHYAIKMDRSNQSLLSGVTPNVNWCISDRDDNTKRLGMWPSSSVVDTEDSDLNSGVAGCIYFERPNNPQYSRYSRSKFVLPEDLRFYLLPMAQAHGNVGDLYANTWRNL